VTVPVLLEEAAVVLWNRSQSATAAARCHVARCHVARCMLHAACCMLQVARCMLHAACCCMICVVHVTCCMLRADRPALRSEDVLVERRQRERCSGARAREELQLDASRLHADSAHAYAVSHTPASALDRKRSRRMRTRRQTDRRAGAHAQHCGTNAPTASARSSTGRASACTHSSARAIPISHGVAGCWWGGRARAR
jgi:hypothetical protein